MKSMPSPHSSARTGFGEWLWQRVSALYLTGFTVYVVVVALACPWPSHAAWQAWFQNGFVRLGWGLFIVSLLVHAWVGMRSVYLDYLHPWWLRFSVSVVTAFGLFGCALWAADILLRAGA
jgi:succinate dehydrogenase / fumarate reductase membrane anchor subunit